MVERTDIAHRPYQVSSDEDLDLLEELGERIVISQLDLIAYANPGLLPGLRALGRISAGDAARHSRRRTGCSSSPRRRRPRRSGGPRRRGACGGRLSGHGSPVARTAADADAAAGLAELEGPFLLALGTDYRHKNRPFALRLLDELRRRHAWDGALVFAGPHVPSRIVGGRGGCVPRLPAGRSPSSRPSSAAVNEAEKRWLLEQAAAVVYPTVYEGFGLVPFEAAAAGAPCLFAPHTSLSEILPEELARLVPWDPAASAERALQGARRLGACGARRVGEGGLRSVHVAALRGADGGGVRAGGQGACPAFACPAPDVVELEERANEYESRYDELTEAMGRGHVARRA